MRVAIIGAGFTGLTAAWELAKKGHEVVIFEAEEKPGGLAIGFKPEGWEWSLERYYHHIFTNDKAIIGLAREVGCPPIFTIPKTSAFIENEERQLDSPASLLTFDKLSPWERVRMGAGLALLKALPDGRFLERWTATERLPALLGREGYERVWRPLLTAKFGPFTNEVNLAWFWARIFKRTTSLGYFEGGFQSLADKIDEKLGERMAKRRYGKEVKEIERGAGSKWLVDKEEFEAVLLTIPAPLVNKLIGTKASWSRINYLWSQTVILELSKSLMSSYWLNILEKDWPFLVAVEQTNFMPRGCYGDKVIVYLGNYLPEGDKRLAMTDEELLGLYLPYLKKINKGFDKDWISRSWRFQSAYAQPVFPVNYSQQIPPLRVADGLFVANMSQVYPWDRGTNYAVELGQKAAKVLPGV